MAFQLSPGVNVTEKDLTTIVPAVATTNAGMVGVFDWGPVNQRVLVDSENNLVSLYGTPNDENYEWWFTAANFLGYGNNLQVVRAGVTGMGNANPMGYTGTTMGADESSYIENETEIEEALASKIGPFFARYPGAKGNSLEVQICGSRFLTGGNVGYTAAGSDWEDWTYKNEFDLRPGTSTYVANKGGSNDEFHIAVIDRDGLFSGERGSIIEKFQAVSLVPGTIGFDGQSNYYVDKINRTSKYIAASTTVNFGVEFLKGGTGVWGSTTGDRWYPVQNGEVGFTASVPGMSASNVSFGVGVYRFKSGSNGDLKWSSNAQKNGTEINYRRIVLGQDADEEAEGYYLFEDAETVDVNLLLGGPDYDIPPTGSVARSENVGLFVGQALKDIVDKRKDCVAFLSCPIKNSAFGTDSQKLDQCLAYRDQIGSSSYVFIDSGYKLMYDIYNDKNRWVPMNGDIAGLCARADINFDPWYSPAGFNRGQIRGVVKLAFQPRQAARDNLYKNNVNPVCTFSGEGTVLYGDKTAQTKPSAFDRINVRRLFIVLEKAIATAAKYSLFEFNDAFTRAQFRSLVEPFLRDVQSRRGLIDFKVVCDEKNNTPEVIDGNRFVADIYIKPNRSINFIQLNFIATRTGVNFSEVGA